MYKKLLADVAGSRPCIPHIALYLREVIHICDGNPKVLAGDEGEDQDDEEKGGDVRIAGRGRKEGGEESEEAGVVSEGKESEKAEEVVKDCDTHEEEGQTKEAKEGEEVKEAGAKEEKEESKEEEKEEKEEEEGGDSTKSVTLSSKLEGESEEETESTHSTESVKVERRRRTLGDKPLIYNITRILLLGNRVNEVCFSFPFLKVIIILIFHFDI